MSNFSLVIVIFALTKLLALSKEGKQSSQSSQQIKIKKEQKTTKKPKKIKEELKAVVLLWQPSKYKKKKKNSRNLYITNWTFSRVTLEKTNAKLWNLWSGKEMEFKN